MRLAGPLSLLPLVFAGQIPFQQLRKNAFITPVIDEFVTSELARWNSSGLSVAVIRQDTSAPGKWDIEFGSYGTAKGDGSPVTPDTLFAIASNSKLFLAASVGLLIKNASLAGDRGAALRWDTKIAKVLPEWSLMDQEMQDGVMIQDMLSHRTGLPRHDMSGSAREGGVKEMISTMKYLRPSAALREQYQYNNLMFETLSYLPPTVLNQTFESYISKNIFDPLGMSSSTYSVAEAETSGNLAHGFYWSMQDWLYGINGTRTAIDPYFQRPGEEKIWAGAAGILTSARDLSTWVAMLLNKGRHPTTNETVIPEDVVDHLATGVSVANGKPKYPELSVSVYGCGQDRYSYRGFEILEHGGSNPGFKTQVARFPNDNLGVIVLSNDELGGHILESVKWRIVDQVLGLEPIDWAQRYADELTKGISDNQAVTPRPTNPALPSVPFISMEGTYSHGAYGAISPCLVQSSPSPVCDDVFASPVVQRILSVSNSSIPTLIAPFKRTFSTHLRFTHFDANMFNVSVLWSNADVRKEEKYALGEDAEVLVGFDDRYVAEWVEGNGDRLMNGEGEGDGWAFSGNFWGKAGEVRELVGVAKEKAEVWFERV
ncbi:beta-lactamase/transpeptidase-like protein [Roridomyces roridus]|uniref:Beta-lactamase/transpeptidase-like protein n=1 Tax=Roridomyces roridus TaxID=1738132 RepID=A0AAD7FFM0_9AGAR|nr:beta-lactamase/transpeptidase-like protein [Roridomyces roridus]